MERLNAVDQIWSYILQAGGPAAVACLGWWLSGRFRSVEENSRKQAELVAEKAAETIDRHELVDQRRHRENQEAIKETSDSVSDIKLILARNGINGKHRTGG